MAQGYPHIEKLYAFIAADPLDNTEGIAGAPIGEHHFVMPLVVADKRLIEALKPIAQFASNESGAEIRIIEFSSRREIGSLVPQEGGVRGILKRDPTNHSNFIYRE